MHYEEALIRTVLMSQHEFQGRIMADFTKLNTSVAELKAKVEALIAKVNTPPPDEQPQVDAVQTAVDAISAEIPQ